MRATVALTMLLAALGCSPSSECRDVQVQSVDEMRGYLTVAVTAPEVHACVNPEQRAGKGLVSACLADQSGRLFVTSVGYSEWIEVAPSCPPQ
jgi:hypothetical protein